jgi:hypothetical protein
MQSDPSGRSASDTSLAPASELRSLTLVAVLFLSGCVSEYSDASPQQYEQAKADCAPHDGLKRIRVAWIMFRDNELHAECLNGARVIRRSRRA